MDSSDSWAIGVDLGGTKVEVAGLGADGKLRQRIRRPTQAGRGPAEVKPNLGWEDEPFREDLRQALGVPVVVTNDVRAATWGEWLYGAGQGCGDRRSRRTGHAFLR